MRDSPAPKHVAIIMDGNSRWAEANGLSRDDGHRKGAKNVRTIAEACADLGVKYLSLFAFSTENWQRPQAEVDFLIELIGETLQNELDELDKRQTRIQFIGDLSRFPREIETQLKSSAARTAHHDALVLTIALNYGGQWDIAAAARQLAEAVQQGILQPDQIDEATYARALSTDGLPAPDLCIRTGGEQRISNFMLWDLAYTELYFTPLYWPEFNKPDLLSAFAYYHRCDRRYGGRQNKLVRRADDALEFESLA